MRLLPLPFFALLPWPALASGGVDVSAPTSSLLQMLLGLGVTLALLVGALYLLKRLQGTRGTAPGALNILGVRALGTREKIVLLSVGGKVLVLGVTPTTITTLHTMDAHDLPVPPPAEPARTDFASRLREHLERRRES